jgi:hypothetical protein
MQTFIRVIEVWTPSQSSERLEFNSGSYGMLTNFAQTSMKNTFAYGEGLPGSAWKKASPVVLKTFDDSNFLRSDAAHKEGLTSAVAIPIFCGERLKAVITFLCGDTQTLSGAIEVWQDDGLSGLAMVDGYYGDLERFEWLSNQIKFPRGRGLPGKVWEQKQAIILGNLSKSNSFLRSKAADKAGITTSIAIPVASNKHNDVDDIGSVVTFLSSKSTPIAKRFEIWKPASNNKLLQFESGIDQDSVDLEPADTDRTINKGEGIIGKCWQNGIPVMTDDLNFQHNSKEISQSTKNYSSLLAVPIYFQQDLQSIVVFYN